MVESALALLILWRLRTPIGYLVIALFVALVAAAPVTVLSQHMRRGLAIAIVYGGIVLLPIGVGAILVPPGVEAASDLVNDMPRYAEELTETIEFLRNPERFSRLGGRIPRGILLYGPPGTC